MTRSEDASELRIPKGNLLRSRVVSDVGTPLSTALDRDLTGYATLVPRETLLRSGDVRGVITFADGIPVLAYNTVTDSGGADALAELAVPGPYRVELYAVGADALEGAHAEAALRVPPAAAATELADDPRLAERTREAAPAGRLDGDDGDDTDAVAAFLDDDERIEAIRERAQAEARQRASEWGLDEALDDGGAGETGETGGTDGADDTGGTVDGGKPDGSADRT